MREKVLYNVYTEIEAILCYLLSLLCSTFNLRYNISSHFLCFFLCAFFCIFCFLLLVGVFLVPRDTSHQLQTNDMSHNCPRKVPSPSRRSAGKHPENTRSHPNSAPVGINAFSLQFSKIRAHAMKDITFVATRLMTRRYLFP